MHRRTTASLALAATLAATLTVPAATPAASAAPPGTRDVIVQLFEWNWPSVAAECQNFLGPRGYEFGNRDQGPPSDGTGKTTNSTCYRNGAANTAGR